MNWAFIHLSEIHAHHSEGESSCPLAVQPGRPTRTCGPQGQGHPCKASEDTPRFCAVPHYQVNIGASGKRYHHLENQPHHGEAG